MKGTIFIKVLFSLIFLSCGCGKKLAPTSPDRWPPKVLNVNAIDEHHLTVYFSERIDTVTSQKLMNFEIFNPENAETTSVIFSERAKKGDEVLLTIPKLEDKRYTLFVSNIKDIKGNLMKNAEKSFEPSFEKDTIPPLLVSSKPSRMWIRAPVDSTIMLKFSEPMDSSSIGLDDLILTNVSLDSHFVWNKTLTEVTLRYHLMKDRITRVFVLPLMSDLSGNPSEEMRIITLTSLDTLPQNRMNIKIESSTGEIKKGYAFLRSKTKELLEDITKTDAIFSFFFIPADTYFVATIAEDSVDTTGYWWGEKKIAFFPDSTGLFNEDITMAFISKERIPAFLLNIFNILTRNTK